MKITKYVAPVNPFDSVFERVGWGLPALDRLFNESNGGESWTAVRLPRTNVHETDDAFLFTLEMPGLNRENVEINLEGDTLVIKGEKSEQSEDEGLVRREYQAARFERTFSVGNEIDRDKVKAKMENGILTVTLPKSAERVGRKIDVA